MGGKKRKTHLFKEFIIFGLVFAKVYFQSWGLIFIN